MKKITREEAVKLGLPKWPQCLITGPAVTVEQAKDIIFRTDLFLTSLSKYAGGNNHRWNEWARKELGHDALDYELPQNPSEADYAKMRASWDTVDMVRKQLRVVSTEFVGNSWASCAYIFGPHGWCHPSGKIYFCDNVGKWPEVKEVIADVETIGEAFPYVEFWLTLMDGEQFSDEPKSPVVTMHLKDGKVELFEGTLEPFEGVVHTRGLDGLAGAARSMAFGNHSREQGLPDQWIKELGEKTRPLIKQLLSE